MPDQYRSRRRAAGAFPAINAAEWPPLLTADQAARMVGLTEQTVRRWLREGWVRGDNTGVRWTIKRDEFLEDAAAINPRRRRRA